MLETNIERISKTTITNVISGCDLNFIKILFDVLIQKVREDVALERC